MICKYVPLWCGMFSRLFWAVLFLLLLLTMKRLQWPAHWNQTLWNHLLLRQTRVNCGLITSSILYGMWLCHVWQIFMQHSFCNKFWFQHTNKHNIPIFIYRHSHIKLKHGTHLHLINAQLGASIVQIIQYLRECGMTEDWKVMRNAADIWYFTQIIYLVYMKNLYSDEPRMCYTLQNDSNTQQYSECATLKQRYHSSYNTCNLCKQTV